MKKPILSSLLAVAALAPIASYAVDGTITFNGQITGQTCTINGGTPNFTVVMPTVPTSALSAEGQQAGIQPDSIKINLTNCSAGGSTVRARFEAGTNVNTVSGRLRNTGTATGVEVGVIQQNGADIFVGGAQNHPSVPIVNGNATLTYGSKYVATATAVAGTVTATAQYTLDFN